AIAQRLQRERPARLGMVVLRMRLADPRRKLIELATRRIKRDAGPQSRDRVEPARRALLDLVRRPAEGQVELVVVLPPERRRQDTDDGARPAVERHAPADRRRIAAVPLLPRRPREQRDVVVAAEILILGEDASVRRLHAERLEEA